jgi:NADH-quinone oxidoreductase subunit L
MDEAFTGASTTLLRWIVLIPLFGAILNGLLIRSKNIKIAGSIGTCAAFLSFAISLAVVSRYGLFSEDIGFVVDRWFMWFDVGRISVPFWLEYTPLSGLMLLVVTGIGTLIHIFSMGYMEDEESPFRFFAYLNLFLSAMLVLVLSSNLVGIFLGWEGVGLCSYLLIGYWYEKGENTAAGMKAFVVNRIGDLGFFIALFMLALYANTLQVGELITYFSGETSQLAPWVLLTVLGALFWASTGKSAQFPLYVWLPDAMAGPTPVSALIHAATMVTSGIFVCVRLWPLFATQPEILDWILWIGMGTAWLAALIALTQRDIKKVLAYSTVSQLGFMFVALGVGSPVAAFFHVVTHAFFKALLFLGAGSVIHGMHHDQDLFEMGGLRKKMPQTHITFLIGTLAIIGFPLTAGFFSKDMILAKAFEHGPFAWGLLLSAAVLTAFYMLRAYTLAFWGEPRSKHAEQAHESSMLMTIPLLLLAAGSLLVGFMETPVVLFDIHALEAAIKASWYGSSGEIVGRTGHHLSHATEWVLMTVTGIASLGVAYLSYIKFRDHRGKDSATGVAAKLSQNKFYVDEIYEAVLVRPLSFVAAWSWKIIDQYVINGTLHFLRDGLKFSGQLLSFAHTGNVQTYAWYIAATSAVTLFVSWWVLK